MIPPPAALLSARVQAMKPVATRRPYRELVVVAALSLAATCGLLVQPLRLRRDLHPTVWLIVALLLAGYLVQLWWALVPRRGQVLPLRAALLWRYLGGATLLNGALLMGARAGGTPSWWRGSCLAVGLLLAMIPALLCVALLWRGLRTVGTPLACSIGAAAGAYGGLFLQLHCGNCNAIHLAVVHGLVIVAPALLLMAISAVVPRLADRGTRQ